MSERMTNVDYGDVLSSIRRLVEEEGGSDRGPVGPEPLPVGSDPLVLTPALRVASVADIVPAAPFIDVAEDWMPDETPAGMPAPGLSSVVSFAARGAARDARGEDPAADAAEAAAIAEIRAGDAAGDGCSDGAEAPEPSSADETVIDEDRLREIVREVIREELQGVMGERITHNIRKLVRAEIHRATLVRDLD